MNFEHKRSWPCYGPH